MRVLSLSLSYTQHKHALDSSLMFLLHSGLLVFLVFCCSSGTRQSTHWLDSLKARWRPVLKKLSSSISVR